MLGFNINSLGLYSCSIMDNRGDMSQCDKYCLNVKINHCKPWAIMFILRFKIFILGFIYVVFKILIP